jgi:hypothetical protein
VRLGLDDMSSFDMSEAMASMTFAEKQEALRLELGMTGDEAHAFLIDMGEEEDS